jgi:hypothetical protein
MPKTFKFILIAVLIIGIFIIVRFIYIHLSLMEVDTTDTMVSHSMSESKKDSFFISEYNVDSLSPKYFQIKEAWAENIWKYVILNDKIVKKKLNDFQLVMTLENNSLDIPDSTYILKWEMDTENEGVGEQCEGKTVRQFFLFLKNINPLDRIKIVINKRDSLNGYKTPIDSFYLIKQ